MSFEFEWDAAKAEANAKKHGVGLSRTSRAPKPAPDGMRAEYEFDYREAKPNRFASRMTRDVVTVVLEPDVAKVFDSSESVNRLLRSVISAIPDRKLRPVARKSRHKAG